MASLSENDSMELLRLRSSGSWVYMSDTLALARSR